MTKRRHQKVVTRRELAHRLGVVMQTITKWEQAGMPVVEPGRKGKPSLYSVVAVRAWLTAREKAVKQGKTVDLVKERARKERAQAILAEQTVAIRARELVPLDEVEKAWAAEVSAVRAKLLSWPGTLSGRLHREATVNGLRGLERALESAVDELLLELSSPATKHRPPRKKTAKKTRRSAPKASKRKKSPTK